MRKLLLAVLVLIMSPAVRAVHDNVDVTDLLEESRRLSTRIMDEIRGELVKELERTGPLRAILVCKFSAPEVTSRLSRQTGMRVSRVSLQPRNPALGLPDAWEQRVLLNFEKKIAQGAKPESMEFHEVVHEPAGHYFRYMRAVPTAAACQACHGANLSDAVKAQLRADYPYDRAGDAKEGALRGAVSIKKGI